MSGELWFYHLERSSLDEVLPELLEKTLSRGWRALVRAPEGRLASLDQWLWTWRDESFTPHGLASEPHAADQPILLSEQEEALNGAQCLFLVDGLAPENPDQFERTILLFDHQDEAAVTGARQLWKDAKAQGRSISYWKQTAEGRWEQKA